MKNTLLLALIVFCCSCQNNDAKKNEDKPSATDTGIKKEDLAKVKWLEGNWKGMHEGKPFYEAYQMINDSTFEIWGYEWDGKDTSNSSPGYLMWKDDAYYLGDSLNYKVTAIDTSMILMKPNYKASNEVLWTRINPDAWSAVLTTPNNKVEYRMERIAPIDSLVKK